MGDLALKLDKLEEVHKNEEAVELIRCKILPIINKVLSSLEPIELSNKGVKKMNNMQVKAEAFLKDKKTI